MTIQSNNNNLNYFIDPTFAKVNTLFVLPFKVIEENDFKKDHSNFFSHYYVPNVEDFKIFIDEKRFFDLPIKNFREEAYKKIIEMSRNNDYTTGSVLYFAYFKENYKLIATDLSNQTKLKDPQQINFIGKLAEKNNEATMFFVIKKSEKAIFGFCKILWTSYKNENAKDCKFVEHFWIWIYKI